MSDFFESYFNYLFPILFIAAWSCIVKLLSHFSGWARIAQYYRAGSDFVGKKWYFQSMKLGPANYSNCVTFGANKASFYMTLLFPFRISHPPVVVPLSDISGELVKGRLFSNVDLYFKKTSEKRVRIKVRQANRIREQSDGAWTYKE